MKILLTEASGYIGAKIYQDLKSKGFDITGLYYRNQIFNDLVKANIKQQQDVENIVNKFNPGLIIHSAADAHTDTCEQDPVNAQQLNIEATRFVADLCKKNNLRLINISTFACFNKNPTSVYPKTKIAAEEIVRQLNDYVILRFSLTVGLSPNTKSKNFYNDLITAYQNKSVFVADSSWKLEMSYLGHITEVISTIIHNPKINKVMIPVIEHGKTSRYQIAKDLLEKHGVQVVEVDKHRHIPLARADQSIYAKYGFKKHTYTESIEQMRQELQKI